MKAIQQKQVEIRRVPNYVPVKAQQLKGQACLVVECPFDDELVDQIKSAIPWQTREWTGSFWVILENDPDQKPDEETNLAFVRRVCKECADRRNWFFADETAESGEAITQAKQQSKAELLEQHVAAVTEVLPKLPPYSLRLIRWGNSTLKLQLARYLSDEDGGELFMKLFHACVKAWKPWLLASFDHKMRAGFVFEVAADPRIIRAIMAHQGVEYLKVHQLSPIQIFDDQTAHLADSEGQVWLGINHEQVDMSELDFDSKDWSVAAVDDVIYWVANRDRYINEWLDQDTHNRAYFGGAFGVFIQQRSKLPELLELFHLEEWFREWAIALFAADEVHPPEYYRYRSFTKDSWNAHSWEHSADQLITHLHKFSGSSYGADRIKSLIGVEPPTAKIKQLKEQAAASARAESRAKAKEAAKKRLESHTKAGLLEIAEKYAEKYGLIVRKSWKSDRIFEVIASNQKLCEELIGLPEENK